MITFGPRKPIPVFDHERGVFYVDSLLATVSLGLLILSIGLRSNGTDIFLSSFAGSVCGVLGFIFSIAGIREGIRDSRHARTIIGVGSLLTSACFAFANIHLFLVDGIHLFPSTNV